METDGWHLFWVRLAQSACCSERGEIKSEGGKEGGEVYKYPLLHKHISLVSACLPCSSKQRWREGGIEKQRGGEKDRERETRV